MGIKLNIFQIDKVRCRWHPWLEGERSTSDYTANTLSFKTAVKVCCTPKPVLHCFGKRLKAQASLIGWDRCCLPLENISYVLSSRRQMFENWWRPFIDYAKDLHVSDVQEDE